MEVKCKESLFLPASRCIDRETWAFKLEVASSDKNAIIRHAVNFVLTKTNLLLFFI